MRAVGVDVHGPHGRQVDDQAVVAHGAAGDLVAAAADAHDGAVVAGDSHRLDDVGHVGAAGDHRRVAVDQPVPHPAAFVVAGVVAVDDLAAQRGAQRVAHRREAVDHHSAWPYGSRRMRSPSNRRPRSGAHGPCARKP